MGKWESGDNMGLIQLKNKKRILFIFSILIAICAQLSAASFSGFMGGGATVTPKDGSTMPNLNAEAFFAGQYSFADILLLRTELSVNTLDNILKEGVFQKTPAEFSIDELSLTLQSTLKELTMRTAFFAGEYESIGSDVFLQRQFGIPAIGSKMTETWQGLSGSTIYPFSGVGLSYVIRFKKPMALGIYAYGDQIASSLTTATDTNEEEKISAFNADIRFAGAWDNVTLDSAFGVHLPIETKLDDGTKVLGLMRYVNLRCGFTLLLGNSYSSSVFMQAGLSQITLNPTEDEKVIELSNVYILCEPRFITKHTNINFTLFNIPKSMQEKLFYVTNPIGCNICISSNQVYIGGHNFTVGGHLTLGANFASNDSMEINSDSLSLQLAPFITTNIFGGKLNAAIRLDFLKLPTINDNLSFTVGYRVQL